MLESRAGEAQRGGLAGDGAVRLGGGSERTQQVGQRRFAGAEGLVDQGGALAQQPRAGGLGVDLQCGRTLCVARRCDVAVQALAQPLFLRLRDVQV